MSRSRKGHHDGGGDGGNILFPITLFLFLISRSLGVCKVLQRPRICQSPALDTQERCRQCETMLCFAGVCFPPLNPGTLAVVSSEKLCMLPGQQICARKSSLSQIRLPFLATMLPAPASHITYKEHGWLQIAPA